MTRTELSAILANRKMVQGENLATANELEQAKKDGLLIAYHTFEGELVLSGAFSHRDGTFNRNVVTLGRSGVIHPSRTPPGHANHEICQECSLYKAMAVRGVDITCVIDEAPCQLAPCLRSFELDIPHSSFNLIDFDGEIGCLGIVIDLRDLPDVVGEELPDDEIV